ncbi:hypothetical protein MLD38_014229 [Melastoma candidum]|uniref:Uncharacterized protein n=1 Tax=Melastoma candidum TaxID=119954 RepID=A0ACB9RDF6_9MYRT|nr:hypothetical protein MLD38_014229 [Melastoma candidum]
MVLPGNNIPREYSLEAGSGLSTTLSTQSLFTGFERRVVEPESSRDKPLSGAAALGSLDRCWQGSESLSTSTA